MRHVLVMRRWALIAIFFGLGIGTGAPAWAALDASSGQAQSADVDGDGRADKIFQGLDNSFTVSLADGTGPRLWLQHGGGYEAGRAQYADLDGDKKADLIFQAWGADGNPNTFYVSLSTGQNFGPASVWMVHGDVKFKPGQAQYADLNGDGKADLIYQGLDNTFWVNLSVGYGFGQVRRWMLHGGSFDPGQAQYADVNADGRADLIFQGYDNTFWVNLSQGEHFGPPIPWFHGPGAFVAGQVRVADANGDGRADLFFQGTLRATSDGSQFVAVSPPGGDKVAEYYAFLSSNSLIPADIDYARFVSEMLAVEPSTTPMQNLHHIRDQLYAHETVEMYDVNPPKHSLSAVVPLRMVNSSNHYTSVLLKYPDGWYLSRLRKNWYLGNAAQMKLLLGIFVFGEGNNTNLMKREATKLNGSILVLQRGEGDVVVHSPDGSGNTVTFEGGSTSSGATALMQSFTVEESPDMGAVATTGYLDDSAGRTFINTYSNCFLAGTPVLTEAGPVPIESIKEGDRVLARNPATGEVGPRSVLALFRNVTEKVVEISVGDEVIRATPNHPFYVVEGGVGFYRPASGLATGDVLLTASGQSVKVLAVRTVETHARTYNFEVADWHNYYVGRSGVLVHNLSPLILVPLAAVAPRFTMFLQSGGASRVYIQATTALQNGWKLVSSPFVRGVYAINGHTGLPQLSNTLGVGRIGPDLSNPQYVVNSAIHQYAVYRPLLSRVYSVYDNMAYIGGFMSVPNRSLKVVTDSIGPYSRLELWTGATVRFADTIAQTLYHLGRDLSFNYTSDWSPSLLAPTDLGFLQNAGFSIGAGTPGYIGTGGPTGGWGGFTIPD